MPLTDLYSEWGLALPSYSDQVLPFNVTLACTDSGKPGMKGEKRRFLAAAPILMEQECSTFG